MKCDTNTMLKTAAGLAIVAGIVYFTVPAAQAFVLASAPLLVALICPISMLFMMRMMNSSSANARDAAGGASKAPQADAGAPGVINESPRATHSDLQPVGPAPLPQQGNAG